MSSPNTENNILIILSIVQYKPTRLTISNVS